MSSNAASASNTNSPAVPYSDGRNIDAQAFNAGNANTGVVRIVPKPAGPTAASRPAPDDSQITAGSRGEKFYEARTFNSHPVLAKVEKIMDGTTTTYKVYLRSGKVLDAPADRMSGFSVMAPSGILDAVGLLPKTEDASAAKNKQKKEESQP